MTVNEAIEFVENFRDYLVEQNKQAKTKEELNKNLEFIQALDLVLTAAKIDKGPTKFEVTNQVASTIDGFIQSQGFKVLDQPMSYLVLDKEFRVAWMSQKVARGSEVLAAIMITELEEFDMLRDYFLPDRVSAFLKMKAIKKETINPQMFGDMIHACVDILANAIVREFEAQSPEFRQLSSGDAGDTG